MIDLVRGNTLELTVSILDESGNPYTLRANDKAIFEVKQTDNASETPIIKKVLTNSDYNEAGELVIRIAPEDTMSRCKGNYVYDFGVCIGGVDFYTTILADTFRILPAIGCKGDAMNG